MRFFRQTLLSVCLIMPCAFAVAQPIAVNDTPPAINEDGVAVFNITGNDTDATFTIDASTVDLDVLTPGINDPTITTAEGRFDVDALGEVTFTPNLNFNGPAIVQYTVQNSNGDVSPPGTITVVVNAINDPPSITPIGDFTIDEDNPTGAIPFTIADVDDAVGTLTVTGSSSDQGIVTDANVAISMSGADGTVTVTPEPNQNGPVTITISVDDGTNPAVPETFILTISPVSDAPTISAIGDQTINEDETTGAINFTIADIDDAVGTLTVLGTSSAQSIVPDANIVIAGTTGSRTVTVTPLADQNGLVTITISVSDGVNPPVTESFDVNITPVDDTPTITPISNQVINEDGTTGALAFTIADPDGVGTLTVTRSSSDQTLIPDANVVLGGVGASRTVTVTPASNLSGSATITITVTDGTFSPTEVFDVTVNMVNDAPTITAIADQTINEDASTPAIGFTIGDIDDPVASLSVTGSSSDEAVIPSGNIVIAGTGTNRTVTVTPAANQNGSATVTITVSDGTNSPVESFVVNITPINDAPTISTVGVQTINEDNSTGALSFNVGDVDGLGSLVVSGSSGTPAIIPNGNVVIAGTGANRTVTVTPAANQNGGPVTITLSVTDGTLNASSTFDITITPVNDAPTITPIVDQTIAENGNTGALNFTIGDIDNAVGTLTLSTTSSMTTVVPNANVVIAGTGASRTVTVTPAANQNGSSNITITVNDGTTTTPTNFDVIVTPVNTAPTITAIANQTINEDGSTGVLTFTIGDVDDAVGSLTVTGASSNEAIIPNTNIAIGGSGASRNVTVTPLPNQNGPVVITLTVSDGTASTNGTFNVTVNPVNDVPTITPILDQTIGENSTTGALSFTVGDIDNPPASLTLTRSSSVTTLIPNANIVFGGSGTNRTVTVTPAANQNGTSNITITVGDGVATASINFDVNVSSVNSPPTISNITNQTINEDGATTALAFTINDLDDPVASLTVAGASNETTIVPNANIVIAGTGASRTVTVTPAPNQNGLVTITLTVGDGTDTNAETFDITINAVSDPPTISAIANQSVDENEPTSAIGFTIADIDNNVATLTVSGTSNLTTLVPNANIVFGGTGANRTVTVTPAANQNGTATITVTVNDGTTSVTETFDVAVSSVNSAPTITSITNQTVNEDVATAAITFTLADLDDPVASLTVSGSSSAITLIPNANIVFGGSGANRTVTVTPAANQSGTATITLTVGDGTATTTTTFDVTVAPVNDLPTITSIGNQTVNEDGTIPPLSFTIGDIETAVASLTVSGSSSQTTIIPNANIVFGGSGASQTVAVTPAANQNGPVVISISVNDGTATTTITFNVNVVAVNDAPAITAISNQTTAEDTPTPAIPFTISDIDSPIPSLTVSGSSSDVAVVPDANIVFGGSGANRTVVVTPATNAQGTSTITVSVTDGTATTTTTFVVTVSGDDDAPTITGISNQTVNEDTPTGVLTFTVGDAETAVGDLTVTGTSDNAGVIPDANIVLGGTGAARSVQITPAANQSGIANITLTVNDGTLTTSTSFQVAVNTVNDAPTITAIANQTIDEDDQTAVLSFTIADVETAATSLNLTATSGNIVLVPNANVVLGGSGAARTIQVTPVANQNGTAVITVNVGDGVNTTSITFQVNVAPLNDLPTITVVGAQTINEDNATSALAFTIADTETAVGALTVTGTSDNVTLVPNTNIVFGGSGASRTVTVTPAANQTGIAVITLAVNDGTGSTTTTFQVTVNAVNDLPTITSQAPITINEEQPYDLEFTDLIVSDVDNPYPTGFTLTVLSNPGYTFTGTTITPNTNVTGNIVVRAQVSDGTGLSNIYNLNVTVAPVNDPPTITAHANLSVNEEGSITVVVGNLTIVDPDNSTGFTVSLGAGANYTVAGNVVTASIDFNGTLTIPVTVSDGTSSSAPYALPIQVNAVNDKPEITGQVLISVAEVQPVALDLTQLTIFDPDDVFPTDFTLFVLGGANYTASGNTVTPTPNFSGTLIVRIFVSDGTINSNTYDLQILVNSTNDPPVITGQDPSPIAIDEGEAFTVTFGNLIVTDPDNAYPTGFTLTVLSGTGYTYTGNTVTPNSNFTGMLTVKVKVNDGAVDSAPYDLQLSVSNINDAPVISGQLNVSTLEDQSVTLRLSDLLVTDPDSPWPTGFTMTLAGGPNYTFSELTVIPVSNYTGTLLVPVVVNDGSLNSAPRNIEIVVTPVNDAPNITAQKPLATLEDQPITLNLLDFTVTDVDNTYPTGFMLFIQPGGNHTFSGNIVTPNANFTGVLDVGVYVSDGSLNSIIFPAQINVGPINDAPTLDNLANTTILEDPAEVSIISLTGISAGNAEGTQSVTVTASSDHPEWFEPFEVQYSGGDQGSLRLKPKANIYGAAQITVRVEDNGPSTPPNVNFLEKTFSFTIDPVNDLPAFTSVPVTLAEPAQPYVYAIVVTDIENEVLAITAPTLPSWLVLTVGTNGNATLTGTPPAGASGKVVVTLEVKDPSTVDAVIQTFEIEINSRPIITSFEIDAKEDTSYEFAFEFANSFTDTDANPIVEIQITTLPTKGTLTLNGNPVSLNDKIPTSQIENLNYVPLTDSTGTDVIGWNASDGYYYSQTPTTVTIEISPVNDPPEIIALEAPESDTLKYEMGSEIPVKLTKIFDARDAEEDFIIAAEIGFANASQEYHEMQDQFLFKDTLGIRGTFNDDFGVLTLQGRAPVKDYVAAIRAVRYNYLNGKETQQINRRVTIKLTDEPGGFTTKDRLIGLIYTYQELDIANAFAPNGQDELIRKWNIYSAGGLERFKDAQIRIYNRRGVLVYEATGFGIQWNGTGPDGDLPADTYYYTIDLKYDKKKYNGAVTILR
jgi:gliding motility-associated-like protein